MHAVIVRMHRVDQMLDDIEKGKVLADKARMVAGVQVLDDVDALVLHPRGEQQVEAGEHMRRLMAAVVDDDVKGAKFLHDRPQERLVPWSPIRTKTCFEGAS